MRWFAIILMSLSLALSVQGQNVKTQEEKRARLEREIEILDRQLSENASKSSSMLSNLTLIRKKVSNRKALVAESEILSYITPEKSDCVEEVSPPPCPLQEQRIIKETNIAIIRFFTFLPSY